VKLELDGAAFLELQVPDGTISDTLQRLVGLGSLPALADDFLEYRLSDRVSETFPHYRIRSLTGAETGKACPLRVVFERARFGLAHPVHRNRYSQ
jgi:hypothetical protein